jgi:hypothetical protein
MRGSMAGPGFEASIVMLALSAWMIVSDHRSATAEKTNPTREFVAVKDKKEPGIFVRG